MDLYILYGFNNSYDRIVKHYDTIQEYLDKASSYYLEDNILNFKWGDGVRTTQIIDDSTPHSPDYAVGLDDDGNIVCRWYILEDSYNLKTQREVTLFRDIVADNYDDVIKVPMYIERVGRVLRNDPAIYNKEGIQVNQIKKKEELLWDKTNWAWIVGYIDKKAESKTIDYEVTLAVDPSFEYDTWEEFVAAYPVSITEAVDVKLKYRIRLSAVNVVSQTTTFNANGVLEIGTQTLAPTQGTLYYGIAPEVPQDIPNYIKYDSYTPYIPTFTGTSKDSDVASWESVNNQYVRIKGGSEAGVYRISTSSSTGTEQTKDVTTGSGTIYTVMTSQSGELKTAYNLGGDPGNGSMSVLYKERVHTLEAIKQTEASKQLIIPADHPHTNNATYDVFCIPYRPGRKLTLYHVVYQEGAGAYAGTA